MHAGCIPGKVASIARYQHLPVNLGAGPDNGIRQPQAVFPAQLDRTFGDRPVNFQYFKALQPTA